jgi:hypothetical protein
MPAAPEYVARAPRRRRSCGCRTYNVPTSLPQITRHSKSVGVISDIDVVPEPSGGAQRARLIGEGSAAQDPKRAIAVLPYRAVMRSAAIRRIPAILDPFGGVARRVIKAKGVWSERTYGSSLECQNAATIFTLGVTRSDLLAPPIGRGCARSRSVLPLRFGRKTISLPGLLGEPGHKLLRIVPAYVDDWSAAAPPALVGRAERARPGRKALIPFREGHHPSTNRKGLGNRDVMNRPFGWRRCRSHVELACRHDNELFAVRAIAERLARFVWGRRLGYTSLKRRAKEEHDKQDLGPPIQIYCSIFTRQRVRPCVAGWRFPGFSRRRTLQDQNNFKV